MTAAAVALVAGTGPALAIPSPELIVGSVSSLSQLVALAAATLGGGALLAGARSGDGAASRKLRRLALGLGLLAVASLTANVYQVLAARQATRERLEATLIRPTPKAADGATLDPLLREIPYKAQLTHPLGLDTAEAEALVNGIVDGTARDWSIIDIRETAETEAGSFPGALKIRFPDLPGSDAALQGRKSLLICHNGNRSAETCAALAARGIDCRFIRGGLEKWLTEGRGFLGQRSLDDLRAIPDYPNHQTLLDTDAVKRLVTDEQAIFVDVRYPGEFAAQHLPGAINLPLRSTPSAEIAARLGDLRKAPVVIPCYDRRSCFFGEILGLMLTRAGGDYRGRYTVPWEYFVPPPKPPHVEAFLAEQRRGVLDKAASAVAVGFDRVAGVIGYLAAIVLAALSSRILVLPFSLKAERDQATARRIAPEVAALEHRFADDPVRRGRALRALYRREGLTPLRNLVALLLLPVMAVVSMAVQRHAERHPDALLWLPSLAEPDPAFVLPLLAALAMTLYLQLSFAPRGRRRLLLWLVAVPMLALSLAVLGAGVNVYIGASVLLLLTQRAVVTGAVGRAVGAVTTIRERRRVARDMADGIVPLSAGPERLAGCGNKAVHLAHLMRAGLAVPDGVVLTGRALDRFAAMPAGERTRLLDRLWRDLGARPLAVRSSAAAEDGAAHSFAGVFDSVLDVDRAGLEAAILRVAGSFASARARAYGVDGGLGNVLLQRMVAARFAGVLFTRDPGAAGFMMIEMVEGNGEALVSGSATPRTVRYSRLRGNAALPGGEPSPIDLAPLIAIGRRAETLFGAAQDVEWAYADGGFYVVQSRDIVGAGHDTEHGIVQREWARVLASVEDEAPDAVVYAQNEMTELLPRPTPLSLSLMNDFWASGGSLDLACRRLGLAYTVEEDSAPLVVSIMSRLYVDERQARRRGPAISVLDARRLRRMAQAVDADFHQRFLPGFLSAIGLAEVADYGRLPTPQLVAELARRRRSFVTGTHVEVDVINVLAQFYLQDAGRLLRRLGRDPAVALAAHDQTEPQRIACDAAGLPPAERERVILAGFGHRAVLDYELAMPRFREDRRGMETALPSAPRGSAHAVEGLPADVREAVVRAARYQALKETAKHHSLRELAELRRLALAIGDRLALGGDVFQLSFDELEAAGAASATAPGPLAAERARRADVMANVAMLPATLSATDIAAASAGLDRDVVAGVAAGVVLDGIAGTRVAGGRAVEGRARVVAAADCERGEPIADFDDGDIIVARMIHPAWIVHFANAAGLVSEIGGWLSHTALLARENDLAMIVAVKNLAAIPDGARLRLETDGSVVLLDDDCLCAMAAE